MNGYSTLLIFLNLCSFVNGFTVSVTCTIDTMQIFVAFEERFHGRLILRPNTDCFLDGQGRRLLLFSISLQAALTERCSIMQLDKEYVGIMEVQMNRNLIVAADSQFLVKCPIHIQPSSNPQIMLNKRSNAPIRSEMTLISPSTLSLQALEPLLAQVGSSYLWNLIFYNEVGLPSIRVGQCVAFLAKEKLDVVELTDTNGCAKSAQLAHDFQWASNWQMLQTQLEMFNATNDTHFYLQCQLRRCADECPPAGFLPEPQITQPLTGIICGLEFEHIVCGPLNDVMGREVVCDPRLNDVTDTNPNSYFLSSVRVDIVGSASSPSSLLVQEEKSDCLAGFCPEINIYLIVCLLFILSTLMALSWTVICWLRPKCLSIKALVRRYRPESSNSSSSELNTLNRLIGQINNSKRNSTLNVDELIRENLELKMCTLMRAADNSSLSTSTKNSIIHRNTSSPTHSNEQFLSLDALPEPPCVSIEEIRQLNRAFNAIENTVNSNCKSPSKTSTRSSERSNSFDSLDSSSSNTTLDCGKRPTSSCSTVDVKTANSPCYKTPTTGARHLKITSLKSLTQIPKLSPTGDFSGDLKQADQSLNDLLTKLRAESEQKRQEATQANNDWLRFLKMDE